jgi:hypothetical protein
LAAKPKNPHSCRRKRRGALHRKENGSFGALRLLRMTRRVLSSLPGGKDLAKMAYF